MRAPRRPGFMTATVLLASVVAPGAGYLAERLGNPHAVSAAMAEEADTASRDRMLELGWVPVRDAAGTALASERGVELLSAIRAFSLDLANGAVTGTPAGAAGVARAGAVLAAELARYPRAFLAAARFRRVLLCEGLREDAVTIPSLPNYERTLLLDVAAKPGTLRRLLHHELFHFADYADDDQVQRDPAWDKLNDHWFVYGDGGRFMRDRESSRLADKLPGFLTRYATSALEEDKAETFAFLMVAPDDVARIATRDPIVRAKVAYVEAQIVKLEPSVASAFPNPAR